MVLAPDPTYGSTPGVLCRAHHILACQSRTVAREGSKFQLSSHGLSPQSTKKPSPSFEKILQSTRPCSTFAASFSQNRALSFYNLPPSTEATAIHAQAISSLSHRWAMQYQVPQSGNDTAAVTAEQSLPQVEPPAVLYTLKRQRKQEHWEFISLVPKTEYQHLPVDMLTSAEAGSAYCGRCKSMIAFAKGQTSLISNHMRVYHPDHLIEYPNRKKARTQAPLVNVFASPLPQAGITPTVQATKEQSAHFKMLLDQWHYGPKIDMPSPTAVGEEVRVLASQLRSSLKAVVQREATYHSATTDIWTDRAMRSYISLTIHYLDANFIMNDWTLEVDPLPGMHTGKHIADAIRGIYERWNINKEHCVRLIRDGAKNAKAATQDLQVESLSCIAHSLHLVVSGALVKKRNQQQQLGATSTSGSISTHVPATALLADTDDAEDTLVQLQAQAVETTERYVGNLLLDNDLKTALESMRDTVQVFRTLAVYFKNSAKAKGWLEKIRNDVQKDVKVLFALDCPIRWSSSWEMLAHFVQLELTVHTFFAFLATPEGKREFPNSKLVAPSPSQWFAVRCLLRLLELFALAVEHLSGSTYPTLAVAFPVLRFINPFANKRVNFTPSGANTKTCRVFPSRTCKFYTFGVLRLCFPYKSIPLAIRNLSG